MTVVRGTQLQSLARPDLETDRNMKSQKLLSLGAGVVAVASIAAGSLLFVDGSDTSASALGLSDGRVSQIATTLAATPEEDREAYLQKLATNLGVDLAKLKEAIKNTNLQTLDEKVADGSITQERADAQRARIEAGEMSFGIGGPGGRHGRTGGPGGPGGFGIHGSPEELATFFGLDAATLRTELQTKSLATIASEQGKSVDELKAFLTTQFTESLAQAVADGRITQAQADEKSAAFTTGLDERIAEIHAKGARGPRGGMPGMSPEATPSVTQ